MPCWLQVLMGEGPEDARPFLTTGDREIIKLVVNEMAARIIDDGRRSEPLPFPLYDASSQRVDKVDEEER